MFRLHCFPQILILRDLVIPKNYIVLYKHPMNGWQALTQIKKMRKKESKSDPVYYDFFHSMKQETCK
jgi:hypothetical protein